MKSLECRIDDLSAQLETQQKIPTNHSVVTSFESTLIESNTDVSAAEYQPKTARNKRISPLARRNGNISV